MRDVINSGETISVAAKATDVCIYDRDMADEWTDAELAELAVSATADDPFADDAVAFDGGGAGAGAELLPEWYMPAPQMSASERTPVRMATVGLIVFAMLLLNGAGLCVTYGLPEIAW